MDKKVFISHSSKDKAIADQICNTIENNGIGCWIAPRDIPYGNEWAGEITKALRQANICIFLFSKNSNQSKQVAKEIQIAIDNEVIIIPIRVENVEMNDVLTYYLATMHWLLEYDEKTLLDRVEKALLNPEVAPNRQNVDLSLQEHSSKIDDLFCKTFKNDEENSHSQKETPISSSVVKKLLQRKEQQIQKTYCSWINEWNNVIEISNNTSCVEFDIPKHSLCGDIGCHFTEVEKENIETIIYEVYVSYSRKANKKYFFVEKLEFSKEIKNGKKFKTYYIEDPQDDGNQLVFLHFDKENNQVLVNTGILLPDGENGHVIKVTKDPLILHFSDPDTKRINEEEFSFDNLTEEQKNDFLGGTRDTYYDIDIDSTVIIIDTETYEPIKKEIVFENGEYKAKLKIKAKRSYFSFKINPKNELDSELTDFDLAQCYYYGRGDFPEDKLKAAEIFEKISDGDSLRYLAHIWLDDSELTSDDLREGIFYLEEAEKLGNQKAGCDLIYYMMKSLYVDSMKQQDEIVEKLLQQISKMTEKDFVSAMFIAGYIYEKGVVVSKDIDKAFYYYYKAASSGEKTAKIRLGIHSTNNESDKESCKSTFCNSQNNSGFIDYCMGRFLCDTEELLVNTSDILHFYEMAADAGNYYAIKELAEVYAVGDDSSVDPNPSKAIMLYEKLIDMSDVDSNWGTRIANYYIDGKGCEKCKDNDEKAFELLSYLLTKYTGGVVANNLGWMYKNGRGCSVDYSKAKKLFESSDCKSAYYHLGDMYENGLGIDTNIPKAIELYRIAAQKGHKKAAERLNTLHVNN